ncbi:hypothetical protein Taro_004645, partial [Colocasia esculenta]|nr:hypothetical protein [Colocasia esculenta]
RRLEVANKVSTSLPPPRRAPWLVFFAHGKRRNLHTFVSLSEEKVYVRELEEMRRSYYHALAQYGNWLFMTDLSHSVCFLLNLLSRKKMMLPPPPRGSDYITDAVITSSPVKGKGPSRRPVILSYRSDHNVFLFHRMFEGDYKWEMAKCKLKGGIGCLVRCNGKIYALGGPLMLDSSSNMMRWVEVSGLGDRAFFFGTRFHGHWGPGMSCSASAAGIAANCIYFVDGSDHSSILKFDMADKSVSTEMSWPMVPKPWAEVAWIKCTSPLD